MIGKMLKPALFAAAVAFLLVAGAAPSFACTCSGGSSCGVPIGPFPCGGTVCGSDYAWYKCNNGSWQFQGGSCSCSVTGDEPAVASVDAPSDKALFAQIMSAAPVQVEASKAAE